MYEVERDYQFFHPQEPDEMDYVGWDDLMGDEEYLGQMAQEEAKYVAALLNRPFNPDDDF